MQSANAFNALSDIFISPGKTFNGLKQSKNWTWLPFALIVALMSFTMFNYYSSVDQAYLIDQQILQAGEMTPAEEKIARASMAQTSEVQHWIGMVGGTIAMVIMMAIIALYFNFIGKMDPECEAKYGDWYAFSIWTSAPSILLWVGASILIMTAGSNQIPPTIFNYASLNQLLFGLEPGDSFYSLLENLNIFTFWGIGLSVVGLKSWTNFETNKAIFYAILPYAIIFGIWFVIAIL